MMKPGSGLQRLLERIQAGDQAAQGEIYEEYAPYLRMVVRRSLTAELRAKFDSIDVVQSVWADLIDGLRKGKWSFSTANHMRAFLVRATKNRLIDYTRRNNRAAQSNSQVDQTTIQSDEPRPSAELYAAERLEQILARCTAAQRPILKLRCEGLSVAEIAARTGYHPSSIRRILYSLRKIVNVDSSW